MKWTILAVGKTKESYYREAVETYMGRLRAARPVALREVEAADLLRHSEGAVRVALDEGGELLGTRALARKLATFEMEGTRELAFLLGGPDGHPAEVLAACEWKLSLSPLTFPYQLARVVLLEQLYRCETVRKGEPYHRD